MDKVKSDDDSEYESDSDSDSEEYTLLKKHFETFKYTTLETILPQFIDKDECKIKKIMNSETGKYEFSQNAIDMMQNQLMNNTGDSSIYNKYTIESAIIYRSASYDSFMVKVMYKCWLGDNYDSICEYINEYYRITDTLDVAYVDGQYFRE